MIITSSSPTRISLFGGGCDLKSYRDKHGCTFINASIDIRQQVTIYYSPEKKQLPASHFIDNILKHYGIDDVAYEQGFTGEIEAGLGSSGSLVMATLANIYRYKDRWFSTKLAFEAEKIEINVCKNYTGIQDHIAAFNSGFNAYTIEGTKVYQEELPYELFDHILLFYTNIKKTTSNIQRSLINLTSEKEECLTLIQNQTKEALRAVEKNDIEKIAYFLNEYWNIKKKLNKITTNDIDKIYYNGLLQGALAGKLMGSGGGGYMMFIVPPDKQHDFCYIMKKQFNLDRVPYTLAKKGITVKILG